MSAYLHYGLYAIVVLAAVVIFALVIWFLAVNYHFNKISLTLPRMKWFTLDEVVAMGYSRFWCKILLPSYHERGYLEVRVQEMSGKFGDLPEEIQKKLRENFGDEVLEQAEFGIRENQVEIPFEFETVFLHEFRMIEKIGRRKRKFGFSLNLNPLSGWEPAKA
jgi:hypothetical protein